ncbi:MAG: hypothetical protein ABH851_00865 [Methanobacteriota archaeon]
MHKENRIVPSKFRERFSLIDHDRWEIIEKLMTHRRSRISVSVDEVKAAEAIVQNLLFAATPEKPIAQSTLFQLFPQRDQQGQVVQEVFSRGVNRWGGEGKLGVTEIPGSQTYIIRDGAGESNFTFLDEKAYYPLEK